MELTRMNKNTVRCIVSEEEIEDMGYSLEEIMKNGEETQAFMNQIFEMAERQFSMHFENGVKTVRADLLPNHILSLTVSAHRAEDIMDHLKELMGGLLDGADLPGPEEKMPQEAASEGTKASAPEKPASEASAAGTAVPAELILVFSCMDHAEAFAKALPENAFPKSGLYKLDGEYFLILPTAGAEKKLLQKVYTGGEEFAGTILTGAQRRAYVEEHGDAILKKNAVSVLGQL